MLILFWKLVPRGQDGSLGDALLQRRVGEGSGGNWKLDRWILFIWELAGPQCSTGLECILCYNTLSSALKPWKQGLRELQGLLDSSPSSLRPHDVHIILSSPFPKYVSNPPGCSPVSPNMLDFFSASGWLISAPGHLPPGSFLCLSTLTAPFHLAVLTQACG